MTGVPIKALLFLVLLSLQATARAQAPDGSEDPAVAVNSAIARDWVARADASGTVVLTSPGYAMPFGQGCVIHRLYFRGHDGRPSLGDMIPQDLYFVFASGDACASVDPARYFDIEPHNDVFGLLDFARRLKDGPKRGRDRLSDAALAKLSRCFPADARGTTRVVRAHSWRPEGSLRYQYQVRLICEALGDREEIVVTGARGEEAIRWQAGVQDSVTVDPVAP
jgi:hypothetical protein